MEDVTLWASGAPCLVALGSHNSSRIRAVLAALLFVTAYAAHRGVTLGAFGNIGGVHGAVKRHKVSFRLAFSCVRYRPQGRAGVAYVSQLAIFSHG